MKVLSFQLSGQLFGIEIAYVKEINRNVDYIKVPISDEHIVGLYNMRGQAVTLFDITRILGYDISVHQRLTNCIILKSQEVHSDILGFVIESAEDVFELDDCDCVPMPANVGEKEIRFLKGVFQVENRLLLLIDANKLFFED